MHNSPAWYITVLEVMQSHVRPPRILRGSRTLASGSVLCLYLGFALLPHSDHSKLFIYWKVRRCAFMWDGSSHALSAHGKHSFDIAVGTSLRQSIRSIRRTLLEYIIYCVPGVPMTAMVPSTISFACTQEYFLTKILLFFHAKQTYHMFSHRRPHFAIWSCFNPRVDGNIYGAVNCRRPNFWRHKSKLASTYWVLQVR